MSKKDKLIKEIDILREKCKDWFSVLFALSSAVIVLVYAILSGEKPIFVFDRFLWSSWSRRFL